MTLARFLIKTIVHSLLAAHEEHAGQLSNILCLTFNVSGNFTAGNVKFSQETSKKEEGNQSHIVPKCFQMLKK